MRKKYWQCDDTRQLKWEDIYICRQINLQQANPLKGAFLPNEGCTAQYQAIYGPKTDNDEKLCVVLIVRMTWPK